MFCNVHLSVNNLNLSPKKISIRFTRAIQVSTHSYLPHIYIYILYIESANAQTIKDQAGHKAWLCQVGLTLERGLTITLLLSVVRTTF